MSETANNEATSTEAEKPVEPSDDVNLPLFPDPTDADFDEEISKEERDFYKLKFLDLNAVRSVRLHCTACDRHLGSAARTEARMRSHPMLRTLMCQTCHSFYNSGEFEKGEDGSELYCRWCGQGGQVYCCSDCPHVFCAKCIKRNFGTIKIKEIENTDDWKCFKCNAHCLWDLRAICWALLRYCDLMNRMTHQAEDPELKEKYVTICNTDHAECCRNKQNKRRERDAKKKEDARKVQDDKKNTAASVISKIPPTIQVKKFASITLEERNSLKNTEKKAQKRPLTPKKVYMKNPLSVAPSSTLLSPIAMPPLAKKVKMPTVVNAIRLPKDPRYPVIATPFPRIRPKPSQMPVTYMNNQFNGFNTTGLFNPINDNINLSLDSLTQGLDMAAVSRLSNNIQSDVVCTPDFPLEPLCEVTEDNTDDDVQCITPGPVAIPKIDTPSMPPLRTVSNVTINDMAAENIIQMTDNDVTVNAVTGGLKFRVDPQTLSSNKMYRLPDGRIFAINANPSMPGGYSATIVALSENNISKPANKNVTYAAKLSSVPTIPVPPLTKTYQPSTSKRSSNKVATVRKSMDSPRECDLNVPIEWYRYNLIDAVDALEYSLSRLNKLKKEATTAHLRTRNITEMRNLHKTLDRLMATSCTRFNEIRENLNKEMKQYVIKKSGAMLNQVSDEDDDVEILNDLDDDPIFIDENSMESNANDTNEVDLTVASSELDESTGKMGRVRVSDKSSSTNDTHVKGTADTTITELNSSGDDKINADNSSHVNGIETGVAIAEDVSESEDNKELSESKNRQVNDTIVNKIDENAESSEKLESIENKVEESDKEMENKVKDTKSCEKNPSRNEKEIGEDVDKLQASEISDSKVDESEFSEDKIDDIEMSEDKSQDAEMSEEMIETLLKDDCAGDEANTEKSNTLNAAENN